MAQAMRRKSLSDPNKKGRPRSDSFAPLKKEHSLSSTIQEVRRENHFWDGVFGVVGIRNHSEIDYTDPIVFNQDLESSEGLLKRLDKSGLINPSGKRKLWWDTVCGIAILYSIILVPFSIGFTAQEQPDQGIASLDYIVDVVFFADICVTFRTAFFNKYTNLLITDSGAIRNQYLRFWFWIDMASTIPFDEIIRAAATNHPTSSSLRSIKLLRILRLSRLAKLHRLLKSQDLKDYIDKWHISPFVISVVVLMLQIFLVAHIVSCFWFYITTGIVTGNSDDDPHTANNIITWTTQFGYASVDTTTQYIISLYWTVQTLLTVGYGDVHPTNTIERAYALVVMLLGGLMFGSIIAKVGEMVDSRNLTGKEMQIAMEEFVLSLDQNRIPLQLKSVAKDAYQYYLKNRPTIAEHGFYDQLPAQLRSKLVNERFYKEIQAIHLFRNSDNAFISELLIHSKPQEYLEGDVIYGLGDMSEEISFILSGSVRIIIPGRKDVLLGCGTVGGFFGDFEFYKNSTRSAQYEAVHSCSVLGINFTDITAAMEDHPIAGSKFIKHLQRRYDLFLKVKRSHVSKKTAGTTHKIVKVLTETKEKSVVKILSRSGSMIDRYNPITLSSRAVSYISDYMSEPPDRDSNDNDTKNNNNYNNSHNYNNSDNNNNNDKNNSHNNNNNNNKNNNNNNNNNNSKQKNDNQNVSIRKNYISGEYLWTDGELVTAQNMEETKLNLFAKTTTNVKYRILVIENGREVTHDFTMNGLLRYGFFHPRSGTKYRWDICMAIVIIYSLLTIPIQLGFASYRSESLTIIDYCIDVLFFIDILINFNLVYYSDIDGAYIAVRRSIARQYLQSWFIVDFLSCFPFADIVSVAIQVADESSVTNNRNLYTIQLIKAIRLIRLLKLFQAVDFTKLLNRLEDNLHIKQSALSLFITIIQVVFISHVVCCMWWGMCDVLSDNTWFDSPVMVYDPLRLASFQDQYIASLYWTVTTLSTVGYGDITPVNNSERILAILIMVMGASVFGYTIANVSAIVTDGSYIDGQATEKLIIIKEFLKECKCNKTLNLEIINHFKQAYKEHSTADLPVMYNKLPNQIRMKLLTAAHREVMGNIALFKYIHNPSVKYYLLTLMTMHVGAEGRCLIKKGKIGSEIFFLVEGTAEIYNIIHSKPKSNSKTNKDLIKDDKHREIGSPFRIRILRRMSLDTRTPKKDETEKSNRGKNRKSSLTKGAKSDESKEISKNDKKSDYDKKGNNEENDDGKNGIDKPVFGSFSFDVNAEVDGTRKKRVHGSESVLSSGSGSGGVGVGGGGLKEGNSGMTLDLIVGRGSGARGSGSSGNIRKSGMGKFNLSGSIINVSSDSMNTSSNSIMYVSNNNIGNSSNDINNINNSSNSKINNHTNHSNNKLRNDGNINYSNTSNQTLNNDSVTSFRDFSSMKIVDAASENNHTRNNNANNDNNDNNNNNDNSDNIDSNDKNNSSNSNNRDGNNNNHSSRKIVDVSVKNGIFSSSDINDYNHDNSNKKNDNESSLKIVDVSIKNDIINIYNYEDNMTSDIDDNDHGPHRNSYHGHNNNNSSSLNNDTSTPANINNSNNASKNSNSASEGINTAVTPICRNSDSDSTVDVTSNSNTAYSGTAPNSLPLSPFPPSHISNIPVNRGNNAVNTDVSNIYTATLGAASNNDYHMSKDSDTTKRSHTTNGDVPNINTATINNNTTTGNNNTAANKDDNTTNKDDYSANKDDNTAKSKGPNSLIKEMHPDIHTNSNINNYHKQQRDVHQNTRIRSQANWNKIKNALPQIANINRLKIELERKKTQRVVVLGHLNTGAFIGHREMMRGENHVYTVSATAPCKYYTLHAKTISRLIVEHPDIALDLQSALGYAVFYEDQSTAEKRAREKNQDFLLEIKTKLTDARTKSNHVQKLRSSTTQTAFSGSLFSLFSPPRTPLAPLFSPLGSKSPGVRDGQGTARESVGTLGTMGTPGGMHLGPTIQAASQKSMRSGRRSFRTSQRSSGSIRSIGSPREGGTNAARGSVSNGDETRSISGSLDLGSGDNLNNGLNAGNNDTNGRNDGCNGGLNNGNIGLNGLLGLNNGVNIQNNPMNNNLHDGNSPNTPKIPNQNNPNKASNGNNGNNRNNRNDRNDSRALKGRRKSFISEIFVESAAAVRRMSNTLTTDRHPPLKNMLQLTRKNHRSASDLLDLPEGNIPPERFLQHLKIDRNEKTSNSNGKNDKSSSKNDCLKSEKSQLVEQSLGKMQRRQSFPSDRSQYDSANRWGYLDEVDYQQAKIKKQLVAPSVRNIH